MLSAGFQEYLCNKQLERTRRPVAEQALDQRWTIRGGRKLGEECGSLCEIDRSAIVWIDQALIPELSALKRIRHAR